MSEVCLLDARMLGMPLDDLSRMTRRPMFRWMLGGAIVLVLVDTWFAEPHDNLPSGRRGEQAAADTPVATPIPMPKVDLDRLAQRVQTDSEADLFNARSWEALAADEGRRSAPPPPPPPPQAPPLPFTFMGKLIDGEQVVVFLTNGARNWVVRAGDTIDGVYRVDAIGDERMRLTYLALDIPQELAVGESMTGLAARAAAPITEALPASDTPRASAALPGQLPLLFAAPSRVAAGSELVVSLGLPPGGGARVVRVELAYDANALVAVGASSLDPGRVTIELGGRPAPLSQVRFRAIAQGPTTTLIGIRNATATDSRGASLPLAMPGGHSVQIVPSGR